MNDGALKSDAVNGRANSSNDSRRAFLKRMAAASAGVMLGSRTSEILGQVPGERPPRAEGVTVVNPRGRVPVGLIIDDSTCLVNLNRFAMPQFDDAFNGANKVYHRNWRDWPVEIPDAFVRKFGEWCAEHGVKGKYSIVPYPACVGRLDRVIPGWSKRELTQSIDLVRTLMLPNWDIHPEMITHTRVIDVKTGHPYPEISLKYMENWDWSAGRSVDELTEYFAYALRILKNVGLPCEGVTTPGGFGTRARPQLAQATLESVSDVFGADISHYFRDLYSSGTQSVAPLVQYASGLEGPNPRCTVHVIGCTGDWTGGWDNTPPDGVDKFITEDLKSGRMVDVIDRGEPAIMVAHWTGIHWNGEETGFKIFQEVVRRLHARYDHLIWMKNSEVARYWAAKELTRIDREPNAVKFRAPFACPDFTVKISTRLAQAPRLRSGTTLSTLEEVSSPLKLKAGAWCKDGDAAILCVSLPKGESRVEFA